MNMVIIDLGDGVKYDSHPEIAVTGAWSPQKLNEGIKKNQRDGFGTYSQIELFNWS